MYRRNGSHSLSPGLLGPPRPLPLLQSHGCPAPTRFSLRARGQEGMPQEQADAGSVREHRPLGLQEPCPLPAQRARPCLLLFLLLFQDKQMGFCWDPWQVSALAPPTVWPAPADTVALSLWAQLGHTALPALGGLMDTGLDWNSSRLSVGLLSGSGVGAGHCRHCYWSTPHSQTQE